MLIFADPCGKFYATTAQAVQGIWNTLTAVVIKTSGLPAGNVEDTCFNIGGANCELDVVVPSTAGPYFFSARWWFDTMLPNNAFFQFQDHNAQGQLTFSANANGTITVRRGSGAGVILGTSSLSSVLNLNAWNRVALKASISSTVGVVGIQINGVTVLTLTGQNTQTSGVQDIGICRWVAGFPGVTEYLQSVYINDATGSFNNDYMGDLSWGVANASRPGSFAQFANNGAATNWQCMADVTPDDLTTYVSDSTPGHRTSVGYAAVASGTIPAIVHISRVAKSDAGSRTFAQTLRSQTTDIIGPTKAPTTSLSYYMQIVETDPVTGVPWTTGAANAVEGGIETIA